jgi:hypothetical protein
MGSWGMGSPIELEFAVNLAVKEKEPKEFALLQIRPLVLKLETEDLNVEVNDQSKLICHSPSVMGHGSINSIYDIIFVDNQLFERSKSKEVAQEISHFNTKLLAQQKAYLLIGVGRWGTFDPWLGIPVNWEQISGARVIVETSFKDFMVTPSQGSHFFQNLTSFMIGYFTVNAFKSQGYLDWDWLLAQNVVEKQNYTKHLTFNNPIRVKMNGKNNNGIILKPEK